MGVVIRDSCGEIMGAMLVHVPLPQFVTKVEAFACRHAVSFAVNLSLNEVIFEGDSTIVIQAINGGLSSPSLYGHIVDDILHLASQLRYYKFYHVNRNCNKVADALAKKSRVRLELKVWVEDLLGDIIPLAQFAIHLFFVCFNKSPNLFHKLVSQK